jgi:hypothetical protein
MNKQPDFGNDLAALNKNVSAEVGDVLQALQEKRTGNRPAIVKKENDPATEPVESTADAAVTPDRGPVTNLPRRPRSASRSRLVPKVDREEAQKNVTTKLSLRTDELLTEAALRQRLKKEYPATRQAIVEVALQDWFRKNGYTLTNTED